MAPPLVLPGLIEDVLREADRPMRPVEIYQAILDRGETVGQTSIRQRLASMYHERRLLRPLPGYYWLPDRPLSEATTVPLAPTVGHPTKPVPTTVRAEPRPMPATVQALLARSSTRERTAPVVYLGRDPYAGQKPERAPLWLVSLLIGRDVSGSQVLAYVVATGEDGSERACLVEVTGRAGASGATVVRTEDTAAPWRLADGAAEDAEVLGPVIWSAAPSAEVAP